MAAKTSWHRYGTKLRHCHLMYRIFLLTYFFATVKRSRSGSIRQSLDLLGLWTWKCSIKAGNVYSTSSRQRAIASTSLLIRRQYKSVDPRSEQTDEWPAWVSASLPFTVMYCLLHARATQKRTASVCCCVCVGREQSRHSRSWQSRLDSDLHLHTNNSNAQQT